MAEFLNPIAAQQRPPGATWLLAVTAVIEAGVAVWLTAGFAPRAARVVTIGLFGVFIVYATALSSVGASTCRCFGFFDTPPVLTIIVDALALCGLAVGSWKYDHVVKISWKSGAAYAGCVVALISLVASALPLHDGAKTHISVDWAYYKPGQRPIVLRHIEGSHSMRRGEWLLLFYRSECRDCVHMLEAFGKARSDINQVNMGIVELPMHPRFATANAGVPPDAEEIPRFVLTDGGGRYNWTMPTPTIVHVDNGVFQGYFKEVPVAKFAHYGGSE
ncbi:MAG: hypothetical protein QGG36_00800 [Pirellulaceae bacterium]|nr:hypothetical protein [Pirellulaceae bacterium]